MLPIETTAGAYTEQTLINALESGFIKTNYDVLSAPGIDVMHSGTTCISALIRGDLLLCANVGDSRAVMGRKGRIIWEAIRLSTDHKPEVESER